MTLRRKLGRYTAGSVVAGICSEATFLLLYGTGLAGPRVASAVAFLAGAIPNYVLNRRWTWQRRGRADLVRELAPYVVTVLTSALAAAIVTSLVERRVADLALSRPMQVAAVTISFAATYGVLFIAKFVVFERLFADRSRHQVVSTTRAYRRP